MIRFTILIFCLLSGCITGRSRPSPNGKQVPTRPFLEFSTYNYYCDSLTELNPQRIEEYLQGFGNEGWEVAMTVVQNGQTVAVCFQR